MKHLFIFTIFLLSNFAFSFDVQKLNHCSYDIEPSEKIYSAGYQFNYRQAFAGRRRGEYRYNINGICEMVRDYVRENELSEQEAKIIDSFYLGHRQLRAEILSAKFGVYESESNLIAKFASAIEDHMNSPKVFFKLLNHYNNFIPKIGN